MDERRIDKVLITRIEPDDAGEEARTQGRSSRASDQPDDGSGRA